MNMFTYLKVMLGALALAWAVAGRAEPSGQDESDQEYEDEDKTREKGELVKVPKRLSGYRLDCGDESYVLRKQRVIVDEEERPRCVMRLWSEDNVLVDQRKASLQRTDVARLQPNSLLLSFATGSSGGKGDALNNLLISNQLDNMRLKLADAHSRLGLAGAYDNKEAETVEQQAYRGTLSIHALHLGLALRQSGRQLFDGVFMQRWHAAVEAGLIGGKVFYKVKDGRSVITGNGPYLGAYGEFSLEYPFAGDFWFVYAGKAERGFASMKTQSDTGARGVAVTIMSYSIGVGYAF